jgi:hypothetical protein
VPIGVKHPVSGSFAPELTTVIFLSPDQLRKPLIICKGIYTSFYVTYQNPIFTVLTIANEKLHNTIRKAIFLAVKINEIITIKQDYRENYYD